MFEAVLIQTDQILELSLAELDMLLLDLDRKSVIAERMRPMPSLGRQGGQVEGGQRDANVH